MSSSEEHAFTACSSEDDGKKIKQELLCLTLYTFFGVRGF